MYICDNDGYCHEREVFASVEDFLGYCQKSFGFRPVLTKTAQGWWDTYPASHWRAGEPDSIVLREVTDDVKENNE